MKVTAVIVAVVGLVAVLVPQSNARSALVDQVTSALQGSFNALNTKRNEWFNNYSTMNNRTKTSSTQMKELLMVSKMALPWMWQVYATTVKKQKKYYDILMNEGPQSLPFHAHISTKNLGPIINMEATLLLQQYRDFQVQILLNTKEIFFLNVNFEERRAVMGHNKQSEVVEETVLAGDHFPAITLHNPFKINVQVMDDCIVASIWLTNLNMIIPTALPEKHIWCTREYILTTNIDYSFNIHPIGGHLKQFLEEDQDHINQEEQNSSQDSQEEHEYEASDMKLVAAVVYGGMIY